VGLRAPAVVRLVGALAHVKTPFFVERPALGGVQGASKLQDATLAERGGATARPYAAPQRRSTIVGSARRQSPSQTDLRHARWSVCARSESFRARTDPGWVPAVDAGASALLACPFAGLHR
jgi:hypothetical protein